MAPIKRAKEIRMITWMQKHRKAMLVVMWVTVITFIGAGAVGWGNAEYGSKATSIAKVGSVELKGDALNREFTTLFNYYNQMFGGQLDQESAKKMGLEEQAWKSLIQKAQLQNLAISYDITIDDAQVAKAISEMSYFQKEGVFNKETYKQLLKSNNLSIKNFEEAVKEDLMLQQVMALLANAPLANEGESLAIMEQIADKIEYLILKAEDISVDVNETALKTYWEFNQERFKAPASMSLEVIDTPITSHEHTDQEIEEYYAQNSFTLQDENGSTLTLEAAKESIIEALNDKKSKDAANRLYIAWKKGELPADITPQSVTFDESNASFDAEVMQELATLQAGQSTKAVKTAQGYSVIKLIASTPARNQTFEEAKESATPLFIAQEKRQKLIEKANALQENFQGQTTGFITMLDAQAITGLTNDQAREFLNGLFMSQTASGQIPLEDESIVLYKIVAQKLLTKPQMSSAEALASQVHQQKEQARQMVLMEALDAKYPATIYK